MAARSAALALRVAANRSRAMDPTTDPALRSWVPVPPDSHFPIQNLPFGVFRAKVPRSHGGNPVGIGVAIGEYLLDLHYLADRGYFDDLGEPVAAALSSQNLNEF